MAEQRLLGLARRGELTAKDQHQYEALCFFIDSFTGRPEKAVKKLENLIAKAQQTKEQDE